MTTFLIAYSRNLSHCQTKPYYWNSLVYDGKSYRTISSRSPADSLEPRGSPAIGWREYSLASYWLAGQSGGLSYPPG